MILKSFLIEKNISQIDQFNLNLIYGENLGLKDDIKSLIKTHYKEDYLIPHITELI